MEKKKIKYSFKKEEKLKKKKVIETLFKKGKSFHQFPFRWVYLKTKEDQKFPIQMGVSVSKRKFKLAVDRNRIKRLMRETWRLNKHIVYQELEEGTSFVVMLIYTSQEEMDFEDLNKKMKKSIRRFLSLHESKNS